MIDDNKITFYYQNMSSHLWPAVEISKVNPLWFRPLQPSIEKYILYQFNFSFLVREESSLSKFEEMLEQERRRYVEKGFVLLPS